MGDYKDNQNVKPHKFYKSVLIIKSDTYNINVNGLDSVNFAPAGENVSVESVADGFAQLVVDPNEVGTGTFTTAAAADTEDDLWALRASGEVFSFSYTDPNYPDMSCSGSNCLFTTRPAINRTKEKPMHEWNIICAYLKMTGGSATVAD